MSKEEKYILARWCYSVGEPIISDMEYKGLEDEIKSLNLLPEYTSRTWSEDPCPVDLLKKYQMVNLIKNVDFVYKSESIRSIFTEEEYRAQFAGLDELTYVSYKIDGWNTQVNYYNGRVVSANTRGRSGNFMNADVIMQIVPQTIPYMGRVKVTGEASIPKSKWKVYSSMTGNSSQRSSMSTVMANCDTEFASFKAFNIQVEDETLYEDPYDILIRLGFSTPMRLSCHDFASLDNAIKLLSARDKAYDYLTDGVVVENSRYQLAVRIYRWQEENLMSYVTGYIENRGSYGNSLVVAIQPIKVDGIKRSKVSVTNIGYIVENDLQIGSPIAFDVRSAANAVLNTTKTEELHAVYAGRYEEFRKMIDERESLKV